MTAERGDNMNSVDNGAVKGMNRRQFLASVGVAGLVAAGAATGTGASAAETAMMPAGAGGAGALTRALFEGAIGSRFTLMTAEGPRAMKLAGVTDNGSSRELEQFTVTFELLQGGAELPQDSYEVSGPGLAGKMPLLLSPGEKPGVLSAAFCNLKT